MNVYRVEFDVVDSVSLLYPAIPTKTGREALFINAENPQDAMFYAGMVWMEQCVINGFQIRWKTLENVTAIFLEELKEGL